LPFSWGRPIQSNRQHVQKFCEVLTCGFWDMRANTDIGGNIIQTHWLQYSTRSRRRSNYLTISVNKLRLSFFYRAMLCIRGTSHGPVSVSLCLSVCLSVTSQSSTKMAKRRITQTTQHDSPGTLVFWRQRSPRNSTGVTPTRAPNAGGVGQNRRLSTNIRLYLENGKRIDTQFLLKSNRKSYALYRMVTLPLTLSAPEPPHFLHFAPPFTAS